MKLHVMAGAMALSLAFGASAQSLRSDLPAVYINTENSAPITSTDVYTQSTMTIVETDGVPVSYEQTRVRGRGTTLFTLAKKPYKIKLNKKQRLLGTDGGNAKKWNLLAHCGDKTLMRDAVASYIALQAGQPFAPGTKYVDLVLNDEYLGTYRLTDQVDIRKKRVNITEQPEVVTASTNITGGYLLEIDEDAVDTEGASYINTSRGVRIAIKSPDEEFITTAQTEYIRQHVQKLEDALFDGTWEQYLDLNSLVQWYIVTELTAEPNAFRSIYFYKEKDNDKFYFGPVWDFDFAFDNMSRFGSRPRALIAQEGRGAEWCFTWINQLRKEAKFHTAVNDAWKALRAKGLIDGVNTYIDQTAKLIDKSQQQNFGLYAIGEKAHDEQHLFSSYAEGVSFLKEWTATRAEFLDDAFATLAAGGTVPVVGDQSGIEAPEVADYYVTVRDGQLLFSSLEAVSGTWEVYGVNGALVAAGQVAPVVELGLPKGAYVLRWTIGDQPRTAKFVL